MRLLLLTLFATSTFAYASCPDLSGLYETNWKSPVLKWEQSECQAIKITELEKSYYPIMSAIRSQCNNETIVDLVLVIDGQEKPLCQTDTHRWAIRSYFSNKWYGDFPNDVDADPTEGDYLIVELEGYSLESGDANPYSVSMSHEWNRFYSILEMAEFKKFKSGELEQGKTFWFTKVEN